VDDGGARWGCQVEHCVEKNKTARCKQEHGSYNMQDKVSLDKNTA